MNVDAAGRVAKAVADQVSSALVGDMNVLVLGGDCTVELGTVAGAELMSKEALASFTGLPALARHEAGRGSLRRGYYVRYGKAGVT